MRLFHRANDKSDGVKVDVYLANVFCMFEVPLSLDKAYLNIFSKKAP